MRETPRQEANMYGLRWRSGDKLSRCDRLPCCRSLPSSLHAGFINRASNQSIISRSSTNGPEFSHGFESSSFNFLDCRRTSSRDLRAQVKTRNIIDQAVEKLEYRRHAGKTINSLRAIGVPQAL